MGRHLTITIASIFALAIAGCSGEEQQQAVEPTPSKTSEKDQGEKSKPFEDPVVPAQKDTTVGQAPPTLIQPVNRTERLGIVSKGRADPFEGIIPPVKIATKKPEDSANNNRVSIKRPVPVLPPLPASSRKTASTASSRKTASTASSRKTASRSRTRRSAVISATTGGSLQRNISRNSNPSRPIPRGVPKQTSQKTASNPISTTPVVPKVMPGVIPEPDLTSVLPPPPQPKLAQAVLVSGVVQVGNQPQAIIKVPTEPTSRYVRVGQRLASGLLVKRIEMNEGSEPVVILEQYGIEVARIVGEVPGGATQPATASNDNSVSKLPSLTKSTSVGAS